MGERAVAPHPNRPGNGLLLIQLLLPLHSTSTCDRGNEALLDRRKLEQANVSGHQHYLVLATLPSVLNFICTPSTLLDPDPSGVCTRS